MVCIFNIKWKKTVTRKQFTPQHSEILRLSTVKQNYFDEVNYGDTEPAV